MHSARASSSISPETVSQAGAGALLLGVSVIELWLAFWAAGWLHRCGALVIAVAGAAILVRALAGVAPPLRAATARRARRPREASAWVEPRPVVVVQWAQR